MHVVIGDTVEFLQALSAASEHEPTVVPPDVTVLHTSELPQPIARKKIKKILF